MMMFLSADGGSGRASEAYNYIADAHEAELTVERDARIRLQRIVADQVHALAAERQRREQLVELLRSVHMWFMQQAPQHYNGCGLWIDVDVELSEHPRENCILDVDSPTLPPERDEYLQCGCSDCRNALTKVKEGE